MYRTYPETLKTGMDSDLSILANLQFMIRIIDLRDNLPLVSFVHNSFRLLPLCVSLAFKKCALCHRSVCVTKDIIYQR